MGRIVLSDDSGRWFDPEADGVEMYFVREQGEEGRLYYTHKGNWILQYLPLGEPDEQVTPISAAGAARLLVEAGVHHHPKLIDEIAALEL